MAFGPNGLTTCISTTGTSKSLAMAVGGTHVRVTNTSTTLFVYVTFGIDSATAVIPTADGAGSNCIVVPAFESVIIAIPKGVNYCAAIASGAGPTLVYFTPGRED